MIRRRTDRGAGYSLPEFESDVTGTRPAWYPFQIQVAAEEVDEPVEEFPENARELAIPDTATPFPWAPTE